MEYTEKEIFSKNLENQAGVCTGQLPALIKKQKDLSRQLNLEALDIGRDRDTFATIRKCRVKTSVESFVPSLQWSPSRFVNRCHQEKNQKVLHLSLFGAEKKTDKICAVQTPI